MTSQELDQEVLSWRQHYTLAIYEVLNREADQCREAVCILVGIGVWNALTNPTTEELDKPDWSPVAGMLFRGVPAYFHDRLGDFEIQVVLDLDSAMDRASKERK